MILTYITEGALVDSFAYKTLNGDNKALTESVIKAIKASASLEEKQIENQLMQIQKFNTSPTTDKVMKAYQDGDIVLLYSKTDKVASILPFIIMKIEGKPRAVVFTSSYGTIDKATNTFSIDFKKLYTLMEAAYINLMYVKNPNIFKKSSSLMNTTMNVYTSMLMRLFNKEYALSLDKDLCDTVTYVIGLFYLDKVWEIDNKDTMATYAMGTCINPNKTNLDLMYRSYMAANIQDFVDLIQFISKITPRMKDLQFKFFFNRYITTYKGEACLGIDYLPYLFFIINGNLLNSFFNSPIVTDIIKNTKGMNSFYAELNRVLL